MTVNLLSQRIKDAKRELTALKTAHMRGLGLVETYEYIGSCDYEDNKQTLTFVIEFSQEYAAYPFFQILPHWNSIGAADYNFGGMSATYSNNGYTATVSMPEILGWYYTNYYAVSFSPIVSVTATWS